MDLSYGRAAIQLKPGQPLRLRDAQGRHLSVIEGAIWVTQDGDLRDLVVEAGSEFVFDRPGLAVVQSLGGAARIAAEDGAEFERASSSPLGVLARLWRKVQRAQRSTQARGALSSLSDRELRDIGLCRSQIGLIRC
ncbi:MAG TPA: DUF2917 domain-containing protein [Burkholderiales bacterium]|jgi:uncharacterized protein YjiS (DUF1127 family)|nr:DUF2917 domain-containing protein [Burkholderiales bacterium]